MTPAIFGLTYLSSADRKQPSTVSYAHHVARFFAAALLTIHLGVEALSGPSGDTLPVQTASSSGTTPTA
jgi:hypothetical protein